MVSNLFKTFGKNEFPFIPVSIFLVVIVLLWARIVNILKSIFKYTPEQDVKIQKKNAELVKQKLLSTDGFFISATGVKQKYTTAHARQQAEEIAAILATGKDVAWYERLNVFYFSSQIDRINKIIDPGFVHSHRKYVIDWYKDQTTSGRNLQTDIKTTGLMAGIPWTDKFTRYFII